MANNNYLEILNKFKNKSAGIFVDEANLFYSQKTLKSKSSIFLIKNKNPESKFGVKSLLSV